MVFGGITLLVLLPALLQLNKTLTAAQMAGADAEKINVFLFFVGISLLFILMTATINLIAGYALVKKLAWARVVAVFAAIISLIWFPLGTILGIYALRFLFSREGQNFYQQKIVR